MTVLLLRTGNAACMLPSNDIVADQFSCHNPWPRHRTFSQRPSRPFVYLLLPPPELEARLLLSPPPPPPFRSL